eukprot:EG_transcript_2064
MWVLGPHNHGLLRLYRFKDPALEQAYRTQSDEWCLHPVRLHAYTLLALGFLSSVSYYGGNLTPGFWMYIALCTLSLGMLLATRLSPVIRHHIVFFHAVVCCVCAALFCAMIPVQYEVWRQEALNIWIPHLPAAPTLPQQTVFEDVQRYIERNLAVHSVLLSMLWAYSQWIPLALTGLNAWTMLVYGCTLCLFIAFALTCPSTTVMGGVTSTTVSCGGTVAFLFVSCVLERSRRCHFLAQVQLAQELHASQLADSILNHTLKNILADVAANLEVFLTGSADAGPALLEDCIARLQRGMQSCKDRQTYLKLTAGEYQPAPCAVRLCDLAGRLVAGRLMTVQAPDTEVVLDSTLITLILENALSNAFQHGSPDNPDVHLAIDSSIPAAGEASGQRRVCFAITNAVNPARPRIPPDYLHTLLDGKSAAHPNETTSPLSYHIGLSHCVIAAQRGGIQLSLKEEAGRVVFTAALDVQLPPGDPRPPPSAEATERHVAPPPAAPSAPLPPNLCFCCIDDSLAAQRLLTLHIRRKCPTAVVHCFGATEGDVARFMELAVSQADVVVLDQHLEAADVMTYGTDLVGELLSHGYRGLVCIRSANDSAEDRLKYTASGAHCFFGKDVPGSRMMDELAMSYAATFAFNPPNAVDDMTSLPLPSLPPATHSRPVPICCTPLTEQRRLVWAFPSPRAVHFGTDGLLSLPGPMPTVEALPAQARPL